MGCLARCVGPPHSSIVPHLSSLALTLSGYVTVRCYTVGPWQHGRVHRGVLCPASHAHRCLRPSDGRQFKSPGPQPRPVPGCSNVRLLCRNRLLFHHHVLLAACTHNILVLLLLLLPCRRRHIAHLRLASHGAVGRKRAGCQRALRCSWPAKRQLREQQSGLVGLARSSPQDGICPLSNLQRCPSRPGRPQQSETAPTTRPPTTRPEPAPG